MRVRKFKPFDREVIRKEMMSLPVPYHQALTDAMGDYQDDLGIGYTIKTYRGGLKMITDSGRGQGRGVFFLETETELVLLMVYKKESQAMPKQLLDLALERKRRYEQS